MKKIDYKIHVNAIATTGSSIKQSINHMISNCYVSGAPKIRAMAARDIIAGSAPLDRRFPY